MQLLVRPLTAAAFAPYGHVVQVPAGTGRLINGGTTERFDLVPDMQLHTAGSHAMLALFRAQSRRFPHRVTSMELNALGSQTFVPLGQKRFVLVVAAAGPAPVATSLAAFMTDGEQGVVLAPGTWHHPLLALDAGDYVVLERAAASDDCEVCTLATPVSVTLPA